MALVDAPSQDLPPPQFAQVQAVLQQYKDVFSNPKTLPPQRLYDHHIPLLPGTTPELKTLQIFTTP